MNLTLHKVLIYKKFKTRASGFEPKCLEGNTYHRFYKYPKNSYIFFRVEPFHRTYIREYENLSKSRSDTENAIIWIEQNHANYGLSLVDKLYKVTTFK